MDGNQFGSTGTYFGDFHDHQAFGDIVHACSAIGFGNVNAKETNIGKLVVVNPPVKARYIRLFSNGNTTNDMNHYIEVEVYGR